MEPYWQLAEGLDPPVDIHIGIGAPGVRYLGFSKWIMFGSDAQFPPLGIERAVSILQEASFLTAQEQRDILCNVTVR